MKKITNEQAQMINGGKTYHCPFGCNKSGSYSSVYWHCLSSGCFKRNSFFNACWNGAMWCFSTAFGNELCKAINAFRW